MRPQLSDQVRHMLRVVSLNADLVCEGIEGPVLGGDSKRNARIEDMVGVGALRPEDEQTFRLNPRLKSFVEDHLGSFQAFRSLTRIDGEIRQAQRLWQELKALRAEEAVTDAMKLEIELGEAFYGIAYDLDRNLTVLSSNLSTEYGNVDSLKAKLRQNVFFLGEVKAMIESIDKLRQFADDITQDAVAYGMPAISQTVRRSIGSRLLSWSQQVNEAQHTISRRLFAARKLAEQLSRLSRTALRLRQRAGLPLEQEFDVGADFPAALLRPQAVPVRARVDVGDPERVVREDVASIAVAMPLAPARSVAEPAVVHQVLDGGDVPQVMQVERDPFELAIIRLVSDVRSAGRPISLRSWKQTAPALADLSDEEWLLFGSTQAEGEDLRVAYAFWPEGVAPDGHAERLNALFHDVFVSARLVS